MVSGRQVGIRLEGDTLARVESHQARLKANAGPSVRVSFSDAARDLLLIGLHAAEHAESKSNRS